MKIVIAGVLAAALLFAGCVNDSGTPGESTSADGVSGATLERYGATEIREYKGVRLDPAVGPRDNSISGIQQVDINDYRLAVTGLVDNALNLTYDEAKAYPSYERVITLHCVEGWDATILWKGIKLTDLFADAKVRPEAKVAIFKCVDGYTTSMPLDTIKERDMLLAYAANGEALPPSTGYPFIVVAEDKLGYKWARWVTEINLSSDESYEGYWEGYGYSNDAEVPEDRK